MDTDSQRVEWQRAQLEAVTTRLAARFRWLPTEAVDEAVHAAEAGMSAATIRDFVPLLVEKEVRDQLRARERQHSAG